MEINGTQPHLRACTAHAAAPHPTPPALPPAATALGRCVPAGGAAPAAGSWAEVRQGLMQTGYSVDPAAGDACLHLAALPSAELRAGPTRPVPSLYAKAMFSAMVRLNEVGYTRCNSKKCPSSSATGRE